MEYLFFLWNTGSLWWEKTPYFFVSKSILSIFYCNLLLSRKDPEFYDVNPGKYPLYSDPKSSSLLTKTTSEFLSPVSLSPYYFPYSTFAVYFQFSLFLINELIIFFQFSCSLGFYNSSSFRLKDFLLLLKFFLYFCEFWIFMIASGSINLLIKGSTETTDDLSDELESQSYCSFPKE